jgi:hypothetical protein
VGFEAGRKYPVAFLIHGGPQGSWLNDFHYRWNPQTYAGAGFAVVTIDFHGSTGYGQAFTDAIAEHWGDRPLEAWGLMEVQRFEPSLARYPLIVIISPAFTVSLCQPCRMSALGVVPSNAQFTTLPSSPFTST